MNYAPFKKYFLLLAFYLVLALVLTYPLALQLQTHIPGHDTDGPAQTWSLWWTRYALLDLGQAPFTTDYLFYPVGLNLVAYTPVFLNGILSIPLQQTFGVIVAQNAMVYFALVSSAFGAYLFVREVLTRTRPVVIATSAPGDKASSDTTKELAVLQVTTPLRKSGSVRNAQARDVVPDARTEIAAVLAGALYGFGAWHLNYVAAGHFMLISSQWLPYYALYLVRLERGRLRDAWMVGLFLLFTAWTELTFIPFLALLTIFYLVYLLVAQRAQLLLTIRKLVVATVFAAVGMAPLMLSLAFDFQRFGYYLTSGVGRIQIFSAEPISFFMPSSQHPILGAWAESVTRANTSYAFIGWAVVGLVLVGLYAKRASGFARFWFVTALLFALLMFGSTLFLGGVNTNVPMPFALLRLVPFVNANRYPVRFNVMLMLALLPLFAWGSLALWNARQKAFHIALAGLLGLVVFEQLVLPLPLTKVRVPNIFETIGQEQGDFTVLELPLGWRGSIVMQGETDDVAQFFQTADHKRRLGGITSRFPDSKLRYFANAPVLRTLIALETGRAVDPAQLEQDRLQVENVLRFFDIRYVSVYLPQVSPETLQFVHATFPLQEVYNDGERAVYRVTLPKQPPRVEIDPAAENARLLWNDAWGEAQEDNAGFGYRWAMDGNAVLWLALEDAAYEMKFRLRGARPDQTVQLRVNDTTVAEWKLGETWNEYTAHVPKSVLRDGLDVFVFLTETTPLAQAADKDRTIGGTGVVSPIDISATGAGFDAGRFGEIYVGGQNRIVSRRGYHLVAIHPRTGNVDAVGSFDTFADLNASLQMIEFVAQLPQGEIVAGVAVDDASQRLPNEAVEALQSLGVASDVRAQFRAGHAFIGIKGIPMGQAVEDLSVTVPATVAIGKHVSKPQVAFAMGPFEILRGD